MIARTDRHVAATAGALALFLLAFAVGRSTAAAGRPEPDLRPVAAAPARLDLPQLSEAAPLPGLAAPVASPRPAPRRTVPKPARARPAQKPPTKPVVIVGSG